MNLHWFETLDEAKAIIEAWHGDYNESRRHTDPKARVPAEFAQQLVSVDVHQELTLWGCGQNLGLL
ncbi:hypothetical protein MB84_31265 [Pandoraea oxalativorans]|uniref:Integrase catalytic domain-containing protein n=1 Tax=Pandoraea oxalativorans TaxID=573737 RepID=A0A192B1D2_9BURK|nr:hypothetical protein MB84_31265 [Pandoraea oxalativorans]